MIPKQLVQSRTDLAEAIRSWCREQRELWQQVPYLALQADGRSGWSDSHSRAYNWGLWTLPYRQSSYYCAFVDCETGDLVRNPKNLDPLSDEPILYMALKVYDAQAVIDLLKEDALVRSSYLPDETQRNDQRRAEIMEQLGLSASEPYRRRVAIAVCEEWR